MESRCRLPIPYAHSRDRNGEWREGYALKCLSAQCTDVTWCKQLAPGYRGIEVSSNLNAICRLDSAWCIGLYIVCVHHDVNAYTYNDVCMSSFELHTCRRLYTTVQCTGIPHWLIRLYTPNHHPVPFLCPWPVPDWWTSYILSSKFHSSSSLCGYFHSSTFLEITYEIKSHVWKLLIIFRWWEFSGISWIQGFLLRFYKVILLKSCRFCLVLSNFGDFLGWAFSSTIS
jgi:hypothetical protein